MPNDDYMSFDLQGYENNLNQAFSPEALNTFGDYLSFDILSREGSEGVANNVLQAATQGAGSGFQTGSSDLMKTLFGGENTMGVIPGGLGALTGLAQAWAAMEQIKLGKEQLNFNKSAANRNFANQAQSINTQLADRQRARIEAAGSGASRFASVEDYMKKHGISGDPL